MRERTCQVHDPGLYTVQEILEMKKGLEGLRQNRKKQATQTKSCREQRQKDQERRETEIQAQENGQQRTEQQMALALAKTDAN